VQLSQWMNEAGFSCHVKGDRVRIEFDQDYEHTFAGLDREARGFSENNLCFELLQAVADRGEVELACDLQPLAIEFDEQLLGEAALERLEDVLHCRGEEENDLVQHARGLTSVDAVKRHPLARIDRLLRGLVWELNGLGLVTSSCCSGRADRGNQSAMYVSFARCSSASFLKRLLIKARQAGLQLDRLEVKNRILYEVRACLTAEPRQLSKTLQQIHELTRYLGIHHKVLKSASKCHKERFAARATWVKTLHQKANRTYQLSLSDDYGLEMVVQVRNSIELQQQMLGILNAWTLIPLAGDGKDKPELFFNSVRPEPTPIRAPYRIRLRVGTSDGQWKNPWGDERKVILKHSEQSFEQISQGIYIPTIKRVSNGQQGEIRWVELWQGIRLAGQQ
jgi:hypothetical protein